MSTINFQSESVRLYDAELPTKVSATNAVLQQKQSFQAISINRNPDSAANIYDLVTYGYFGKIIEKQKELPSVTFPGKLMDGVVRWFGGKENQNQENQITSEEKRSIAQKYPEYNEVVVCQTEASNECLCYQYKVSCSTGKIGQEAIGLYNFTSRVYAYGNQEKGCTIPENTKTALSKSVKDAIFVNQMVLDWGLDPSKNYTQEFTIPPLDNTSWKVIVTGPGKLESTYYEIFNNVLQTTFNHYKYEIENESLSPNEKIILSSGAGGVILCAIGYIASRYFKFKSSEKKQTDEEIPLNQV
jgi:hypothetical protein